ncbi:MAG: hypothetical protein JW821_09790 [Deltaproteobacteria bacterium]|nr:hypothetical protein [Deltaproteobacteria bacterium]
MARAMKSIGIGFLILMLSGLAYPVAATNSAGSALKTEIQDLAVSMMNYMVGESYDYQKRPSIRVAIFDTKDLDNSVTIGSRYLTNQIRFAFGKAAQFELLPCCEIEEQFNVTFDSFARNVRMRNFLLEKLQADFYVLGAIKTRDRDHILVEFRSFNAKGEPLLPLDPFRLSWQPKLSASGYAFFKQVLLSADQAKEMAKAEEPADFAEVIILTQPITDDVNPWWQIQDGLMFPRSSRASIEFNPKYGYGSEMASRIKTHEEFEGTGFAVARFGLLVKTQDQETLRLESYRLPKESDYYFITDKEGNQYRFEYIWYQPDQSDIPSSGAGGIEEAWKIYVAKGDWALRMPVGTHIGLAELDPITQKLFGASTRKPTYHKRFRFVVEPGLNIYVVNFAHMLNQPKIFIRRLDISEGAGTPIMGTVKKLIRATHVYGSD